MRLMFVYNLAEDVGSAQTIHNYCQAGKALGHDVTVYRPTPGCVTNHSLDVDPPDAVIFVLEWWLEIKYAGHLNLVRLLAKVPRARRIVIDNDGMYNDVFQVNGDSNYLDAAARHARRELIDSLSDKILQPTLHPIQANVRSFLFHGYNPGWEVPLHFRRKPYGMCYVGNNWFRWRPMKRVLEAIEPIHKQVGPILVTGYAWDPPAYWLDPGLRQQACYTNPEYLRRLGVEVKLAVPFRQVIPAMGNGVFNPVLQRPLFNHLQLLTPRLFETPAANTIPLFSLDPQYVQEIYGKEALELVLPHKHPEQKVHEVVSKPAWYTPIVQAIRGHLAAKHSYEVRLQELVEIVKS
jgi:hypothetical protein